MNLEVRLVEKEDIEYLFLSGEIDAYTAPSLREKLIPLTERNGQDVIVDLTEVNYIDSTGLGIFIGALKSTHKNDSSLKLVGVSERLERLFNITGLDEVIDIKTVNGRGKNDK